MSRTLLRMSTIGIVVIALGGCSHRPDRLTVMAGSHHVAAAEGEKFNPINPGLIARFPGDFIDINVGGYVNSYGRPSATVLASLPIIETDNLDVAVFAGAAYYPEDGRRFAYSMGDIVPVGGIEVRAGHFAIQIMPSDCVYTCAVVSAGLSFALE